MKVFDLKSFSLKFIGLLIILIFQISTITQAPSIINAVKVGDKKTYQIDKYFYFGASSHTFTVKLQDGTTTDITLKKGLTFTLRICNESPPDIYKQYIIHNQTTECLIVGPPDLLSVYIFSITNKSYYQELVNRYSYLYTLNGNVFTNTTNITTSLFSQYIVYIYLYVSFDITTGWTTSSIDKEVFDNGTLFYDLEISQVTNNNYNFLNESELEIFSIFIIVAIVILILIIKKFDGLRGENNNKKDSRKQLSNNIDKITNKLEEIIEENKTE